MAKKFSTKHISKMSEKELHSLKMEASEVRTISSDEANDLPGLGGIIIRTNLREFGFAAVTINDRKVFFELL